MRGECWGESPGRYRQSAHGTHRQGDHCGSELAQCLQGSRLSGTRHSDEKCVVTTYRVWGVEEKIKEDFCPAAPTLQGVLKVMSDSYCGFLLMMIWMSKNEDYFRLPAATRRQHVVNQLGLQSSFPETSTHLDYLLSNYIWRCTMEPWHACYGRIVEPFDCRRTKYCDEVQVPPYGEVKPWEIYSDGWHNIKR